jgi:hypothetical protein
MVIIIIISLAQFRRYVVNCRKFEIDYPIWLSN